MADLVNNLELRRVAEESNKKISALVNALKEQGITNLDTVLKTVTTTAESKAEQTLKSLKEKWQKYKSPALSFEDFYELINLHKAQETERENQRDLDKYVTSYQDELARDVPRLVTINQGQNANVQPFVHYLNPDNSATAIRPDLEYQRVDANFRHVLQGAEGKLIPCYPHNGMKMKVPLKYQRQVTLDLFTQEISFYSLTNICELDVTLENIMDKAERLGLTRQNLADTFKLLIQTHFKDYHFTVANLKSPREVFEKALLLINSEQVLLNIKEQLRNFSRLPGSTVKQTWSRYMSLSVTRLTHQEPSLNQEQIMTKAERLSNFLIPQMTNPQTRDRYNQWLAIRRQEGENPGSQEICAYLGKLEAGDETYKLTEETRPSDSISLEKVNLFMSGVDMHMTEATWKSQQRGSDGRWQKAGSRGRGGNRGRGNRSQSISRGGQQSRHQDRGGGQPQGGHNSRRNSFHQHRADHQHRDRSHSRDQSQHRGQSRGQSADRGQERDRSRSQSRGRSQSQGGGQQRWRGRGRGGYRGRGSYRGRDTPAGRLHQEWRPRGAGGAARGPRSQTPGNLQCLRCLRTGSHRTEECRTYSVTAPGQCYNCGQGLHRQSECRNSGK